MFELLGEGAAQRERSRRKEEDAGQELDTVLVSKAELLERIAGAEELEQKVRLHIAWCMHDALHGAALGALQRSGAREQKVYFHRHWPILSPVDLTLVGWWGAGSGWLVRWQRVPYLTLCLPQVKEQQMQAEYQTHLKEQYYLDQIKKDKEESQTSLEGANERLEGIKRTKEAQGREASEVMQAMEVAHMRAAEELENLYERKLAAEAARFEALRQEKEDMQCQFEVCALAPARVCLGIGGTPRLPRFSGRPQERLFGLHKQAKSDEEKLRAGLEDKRRDAESRALDVQHKAGAMRSQYEEMLRQVRS
tara:strand:- start:1166 stop:2089 length:924 start_codon:yes stop_codon:yes gene_type:complete